MGAEVAERFGDAGHRQGNEPIVDVLEQLVTVAGQQIELGAWPPEQVQLGLPTSEPAHLPAIELRVGKIELVDVDLPPVGLHTRPHAKVLRERALPPDGPVDPCP
jgi:hypothetical protein